MCPCRTMYFRYSKQSRQVGDLKLTSLFETLAQSHARRRGLESCFRVPYALPKRGGDGVVGHLPLRSRSASTSSTISRVISGLDRAVFP